MTVDDGLLDLLHVTDDLMELKQISRQLLDLHHSTDSGAASRHTTAPVKQIGRPTTQPHSYQFILSSAYKTAAYVHTLTVTCSD